MCTACLGALVRQPDLIPLLDSLSEALAKDMQFDHPIEPVLDHAGKADCPRCGQHMHTFGYLGSPIVYADRCTGCALIWTDPEELGVMAALYARTHHRIGVRRAEQEAWQEGMNKRVRRLLGLRIG